MRRTFKIMLMAGVIAAIGGVIYMAGEALWDEGNAVGPPASAPPPPSVPVAKALSRTLAPTAEFTGFLAALETVELRSRVGGTLDAVSVPEGRLVSRGQLLFQIDPRPFEVALDTAVAQLRQAEVLAARRRRISIAFNDWSPAAPYHVKTLTMSPPRVMRDRRRCNRPKPPSPQRALNSPGPVLPRPLPDALTAYW